MKTLNLAMFILFHKKKKKKKKKKKEKKQKRNKTKVLLGSNVYATYFDK